MPKLDSIVLMTSEATYPVGQVTVVASERGLVAILFDPSGVEALDGSGRVEVVKAAETLGGPEDLDAAGAPLTNGFVDSSAQAALGHLNQAHRELGEYFNGDRTDFGVNLDLETLRELGAPGSTPFQQTVQRAMTEIPYGETQSYGQLAASVGNPGAARAVGSACANNPFPIVVPCHRVVRSDGSRGQYTGGKHIKETLLALEEAVAKREQKSP